MQIHVNVTFAVGYMPSLSLSSLLPDVRRSRSLLGSQGGGVGAGAALVGSMLLAHAQDSQDATLRASALRLLAGTGAEAAAPRSSLGMAPAPATSMNPARWPSNATAAGVLPAVTPPELLLTSCSGSGQCPAAVAALGPVSLPLEQLPALARSRSQQHHRQLLGSGGVAAAPATRGAATGPSARLLPDLEALHHRLSQALGDVLPEGRAGAAAGRRLLAAGSSCSTTSVGWLPPQVLDLQSLPEVLDCTVWSTVGARVAFPQHACCTSFMMCVILPPLILGVCCSAEP